MTMICYGVKFRHSPGTPVRWVAKNVAVANQLKPVGLTNMARDLGK
jgi:hypothetical protein